MLRRIFTLAAALATPLLALSPAARADIIPDGKTFVPLMLTLDGQDAFKDTTLVIAGCNSENGRHYVAFAKPNEVLVCRVKMAPVVHAIPTADRKAIEDLVAKDVGWGTEGIEVRKLLEKAPACGTIEESTLVDTSAGIKEVAARYAIEKTASGCSLKKVSSTNVLVNAAPTGAPTPSAAPANNAPPSSAAATSSAAPAAPTPSDPPAKQSGCAMSPAPASTGVGAWLFALAAGFFAIARRKQMAQSRK